MINLLWTPQFVVGQMMLMVISGHVDANQLAAHADSTGIPVEVGWALAWRETRSGRYGNRQRGLGKPDSLGRYICREIGRLQLSPCQKYTQLDPRCTLQGIKSNLDANIRCGFLWYKEKLKLCHNDHSCAIMRYNGQGPKAREYQKEAHAYIGRIHLLLLPE